MGIKVEAILFFEGKMRAGELAGLRSGGKARKPTSLRLKYFG